MNLQRRDIDWIAFAFALASLAAISGAFIAQRNGAAAVMCGICLSALVAGRLLGIPGRVLLPVAVGLAVLLYVVWINPPGGPRQTSAAAHASGGLLVGWAFSEVLRKRVEWPRWGGVALLAVVAVTVSWEISEWIGDRLLETALIPDRRDSALDISFGCLGAIVAVSGVRLLTSRSASDDPPTIP